MWLAERDVLVTVFQRDVGEVKPLRNRRVVLTFCDGLVAPLCLDDIVYHYKGVFLPLLDAAYFNQVAINRDLGTIVWPNGADVCPDMLYAVASGKPIVCE